MSRVVSGINFGLVTERPRCRLCRQAEWRLARLGLDYDVEATDSAPHASIHAEADVRILGAPNRVLVNLDLA
jgi:hypothetical protein